MPAANTDGGARAAQPKKKVVGKVKPPSAKQVTQASAQEQQYGSQAHAVRVQGNRQTRVMGKSPSGDRPQNRAKQMDAAILHVGPSGTGKKLHAPALPRGAQQRGTSPAGDRPQGRAQEMRAAPTVARVKKKTGGGGLLMGVAHLPKSYVGAITNNDVNASGLNIAGNAVKDAAELAVTTPSSLSKLASTAVTHPKKVPGMLAEPYKQLLKDPQKAISEHPVSTALMLAPAARLPGRVVGKAARVAGKQTLERPAATLPGTALKEARTGSRDVVVRAVQAKSDRNAPAATMTPKEVQRRVDEHYDVAKQHAARAEAQAVHATRTATRGQPKQVRREAVTAAREKAREVAQAENDARFAREFGATGRLSTGAAERELVGRVRAVATGKLTDAKAKATAADVAHEAALANAKTARVKVKKSPKLAALESRRRDALREVAHAQRAQTGKVAEFGVARGRAEVLSRNVAGTAGERRAQAPTVPVGTSQYAGGGHGVRLAADELQAHTQRVRAGRDRVRQLDQQIAVERARIKGIPPAEHQALLDTIHARATTRTELSTARAAAEAAKAQHVGVKVAMRGADIVSPAREGRLFAHKADAATIVRKLNEQAPEGSPMMFVVHQAGEKFAAVPQVAKARLTQHRVVGSSPATMAKVMRRSRQAFTQAVLPLSPKWLAGQGVEAGVRAAVARAGPMDVLRTNKVVKKLNAQKAGSGDELLMRISGGQFGLTGTAREFAEGKSLADEFQGKSLERPAKAVTAVGATPPLKAVRAGWGKYTATVLDSLNSAIENTARKAMAGQAIKQGPLMERHILGMTDKALEDAAHGLKGTENQVRLAREVDRMYGKYQKFSPEKRSMLLHWTPFLPWYLNVASFLTKVLPVDHPVVAALVADTGMATEEWRKQHHLSLHDANHVPGFLLGSAPAGGDAYRRVGHYLPFAPADPAEATGSLLLPQVTGTLANLAGVDWKGQRLKRPGYSGKEFNVGEKTIRALVTAAESQIPGVAQAGAISGVTPRLVDKKDPAKVKSPVEVLKGYSPTAKTKSAGPPAAAGSGKVPGRVSLPGGVTGRVKVPGGVTGRVKVPGG